MRVLALDLGSKRIGVAVSDPGGLIAQPLPALSTKADLGHLADIERLVTEHTVERMVVGLPLRLDGKAGPEAEQARQVASMISQRTGLVVDLYDERMTTKVAERSLLEMGRKRDKRRLLRDSVAATILLQDYLARKTVG